MNETIKVTGNLKIYLNDKLVLEKKNLVVTTGLNFLANPILNSSTSPFTYMAIGTGTTAPALTDTTLQTEISRQAFTSTSLTGNIASLSCLYAAGVGTGTISEAGLFNAATAGTMLSRVTFSGVPKGASDSLNISWTITVG